MEEEEDEWEAAADNFQVKPTASSKSNNEDQWDGAADDFTVSSLEIQSHVAGERDLTKLEAQRKIFREADELFGSEQPKTSILWTSRQTTFLKSTTCPNS